MTNTGEPLFYVDNLQVGENADQYTAALHFPSNFTYKDYNIVGNSPLIPDIFKIEVYITGDKTILPDNNLVVTTIDLDLSGQTFKFIKFKIVWLLSAGVADDVGGGDPEENETVGESVLSGMG